MTTTRPSVCSDSEGRPANASCSEITVHWAPLMSAGSVRPWTRRPMLSV
ncbi:hypothetical protein [Streptomyces sudanensis]|nr:hypothetical protein [Streptomyces sudanensis]MCP9956397.1 hypothetical protein [Streptomyces sudanensis]